MKRGWLFGLCLLAAGMMLATPCASALAQDAAPLGSLGPAEILDQEGMEAGVPDGGQPADGLAEESPEDGAELYYVAGYCYRLPEGWIVAKQKEDVTQLQFLDWDGKQGICAVATRRIEALQEDFNATALLQEACFALGGEEVTLMEDGGRTVALFDVKLNGKEIVSDVVFMDGMDVIVTQTYILEAEDTARQRELGLELIRLMEPAESAAWQE